MGQTDDAVRVLLGKPTFHFTVPGFDSGSTFSSDFLVIRTTMQQVMVRATPIGDLN